jgi:hypothetical protein
MFFPIHLLSQIPIRGIRPLSPHAQSTLGLDSCYPPCSNLALLELGGTGKHGGMPSRRHHHVAVRRHPTLGCAHAPQLLTSTMFRLPARDPTTRYDSPPPDELPPIRPVQNTDTQYLNPNYQNYPYPNYPITILDTNYRYLKLVRVITRGTRVTHTT